MLPEIWRSAKVLNFLAQHPPSRCILYPTSCGLLFFRRCRESSHLQRLTNLLTAYMNIFILCIIVRRHNIFQNQWVWMSIRPIKDDVDGRREDKSSATFVDFVLKCKHHETCHRQVPRDTQLDVYDSHSGITSFLFRIMLHWRSHRVLYDAYVCTSSSGCTRAFGFSLEL